MNEQLFKVLDLTKQLCSSLADLVEDNHLENSQEYLNWQDELNEISVRCSS